MTLIDRIFIKNSMGFIILLYGIGNIAKWAVVDEESAPDIFKKSR